MGRPGLDALEMFCEHLASNRWAGCDPIQQGRVSEVLVPVLLEPLCESLLGWTSLGLRLESVEATEPVPEYVLRRRNVSVR